MARRARIDVLQRDLGLDGTGWILFGSPRSKRATKPCCNALSPSTDDLQGPGHLVLSWRSVKASQWVRS